ncbi:MAG: rhomboid family intramembrane serine protease [Candidatus Woesearchaeota archaeon]
MKKNTFFKKPFLFFESLLKSILATLKQPVFLIFPFLLILLFYIPNESFKFILKLNVSKPEIWQFFTSSFVHENLNHLFTNLKYYFLIVFILGFIFFRLKQSNVLSKLFFLILLSYWIIETLFFLIIKFNSNSPIISCGSSGIVFSLFGVFFSSLIYAASIEQKQNFMKFNIFNLVISSILLIIYYSYNLYQNNYLDYSKFSLFIILSFIFFILLIILLKFYNKEVYKIRNILIISLAFHFIIFLVFFPSIEYTLNLGINYSSHFIGFLLGLLISGIYLNKLLKKEFSI